jgi:hypothetical protein
MEKLSSWSSCTPLEGLPTRPADFVVGKTRGGEDGDLLATGDRVHRVDGGDTGRDHLFGVDLSRVSRKAQ